MSCPSPNLASLGRNGGLDMFQMPSVYVCHYSDDGLVEVDLLGSHHACCAPGEQHVRLVWSPQPRCWGPQGQASLITFSLFLEERTKHHLSLWGHDEQYTLRGRGLGPAHDKDIHGTLRRPAVIPTLDLGSRCECVVVAEEEEPPCSRLLTRGQQVTQLFSFMTVWWLRTKLLCLRP